MSFVLNRKIFSVRGDDASKFLGDLITNNLPDVGGIQYAALLSPQGKYLFDFFVVGQPDGFLLDVDRDVADAFAMRLTMYKLRAEVAIEAADIDVSVGVADAPSDALPDPRSEALGWRLYNARSDVSGLDWNAIYVENCIPRTGVELISDQTYILESGFERLNGVDFKKGCYVGQEVTARMKHKTELRKGLGLVQLSAEVPVGSDIVRDGKLVGTVYSQAKGQGIAYLRFDRMGEGMEANGVSVSQLDAF